MFSIYMVTCTLEDVQAFRVCFILAVLYLPVAVLFPEVASL